MEQTSSPARTIDFSFGFQNLQAGVGFGLIVKHIDAGGGTLFNSGHIFHNGGVYDYSSATLLTVNPIFSLPNGNGEAVL